MDCPNAHSPVRPDANEIRCLNWPGMQAHGSLKYLLPEISRGEASAAEPNDMSFGVELLMSGPSSCNGVRR